MRIWRQIERTKEGGRWRENGKGWRETEIIGRGMIQIERKRGREKDEGVEEEVGKSIVMDGGIQRG